jgi:hypothetical protein
MRNVGRVSILVCALALSVGSAAPDQGQPQQQQGGYAGGGGQDPSGCDVFCNHYLGCKGIQDPNTWQACHGECLKANADPNLLYQYAQTDCATAVSMIDGNGQQGGMQQQPQGGQQQQGGGPRPGSKECDGCVRDGDSCVWVSQGNWGAGPYSGAAADCARSCCF